MSPRGLNILLTHQDARRVGTMIDWWRRIDPDAGIMIAYGGAPREYERIEWPNKLQIGAERLRTRVHHREMQSYTAIIAAATRSGALDGYEIVHLAEYDQIPLQPCLSALQREQLERERADVLAYSLFRIDGTNDGHYLNHWRLAEFRDLLARISLREDRGVVFKMFGFGSVWRAAAFRALAAIDEPVPLYLEVFLPSVAHHLGYRIRPVPDAADYATHAERNFQTASILEAASLGRWNIHPVKWLWDDPGRAMEVASRIERLPSR